MSTDTEFEDRTVEVFKLYETLQNMGMDQISIMRNVTEGKHILVTAPTDNETVYAMTTLSRCFQNAGVENSQEFSSIYFPTYDARIDFVSEEQFNSNKGSYWWEKEKWDYLHISNSLSYHRELQNNLISRSVKYNVTTRPFTEEDLR